jgi:predicted RNase H-like HicB family nuclease
MSTMTLTAVFTAAPEGGFVAFNPETGTTTQGETIDEALVNLKEATELYLEEFPAATSQGGPAWVTTFEVSSAASAAN